MKKIPLQFTPLFLQLIVTFIALPFLPAKAVSHFSLDGTPDGYSSKWFLFPWLVFLNLLLTLLFLFIERRKQIKQETRAVRLFFYGLSWAMPLFMLLLACGLMLWNLGVTFPITLFSLGYLLIIALAFLLLLLTKKQK